MLPLPDAASSSGEAKRLLRALPMPKTEAPPENLSSGEVGAEEHEEKETADAEVRRLPDHALLDKMLRAENLIKAGVPGRHPDRGKKLHLTLDAIRRELARRKLLREAAHPHGGGGGPGARAQDDKGCEKVVQSSCVESSGIGPPARMLMATVLTENLCSGEVRAEEDKEKERAHAVQQLPNHALWEKKLRVEKLIKTGLVDYLPDGGKRLRFWLDTIYRELKRRKSLSKAVHPHNCSDGGNSGPGARAQDENGCKRIVRSRCAEIYGTGPRAYVSRRVILSSALKAIKGSEAIFRSVDCSVPDRFAVEVSAEAPWRGMPGNVRCLKAMSGPCDSMEEAEESAANCLVSILQMEYGVVVDDFNYASLCEEREKKKAYRAAAEAFESGWKQSLDDMESMKEKSEKKRVDAMADFPFIEVTSSSV